MNLTQEAELISTPRERSYALSPLGVEMLSKEISGAISTTLKRDGCSSDDYDSLLRVEEILKKYNLYHEN